MTSGVAPPTFQDHVDLLAALDTLDAALVAYPSTVVACPSDELGSVLGRLSAVAARIEAARVVNVRQAASRGLIAGSDATSPTDWIVAQTTDSPTRTAPVQVADAAVLARVAYTCRHPEWSVLDEALLAGRVARPN